MLKIGILALQGDFAKHEEMLKSLGAETVQVKLPGHLDGCGGLIIPGGESTTLTKLMDDYGLYSPILEFAKKRPVMGTCAGSIMIAAHVSDSRVKPLGLIDVSISRNAYGRQVDSFIADIGAPYLKEGGSYRSIFIRAPQIESVGKNTEILMEFQGKPVMVRENKHLALTFHPELTNDSRIHQYFLDLTAE